jgi:hypothetical protein
MEGIGLRRGTALGLTTDKAECYHRKNHRAADLEAEVWEHISQIMKDPEQGRAP